MGLRYWLPWRTKAERRGDIKTGFGDVAGSLLFLGGGFVLAGLGFWLDQAVLLGIGAVCVALGFVGAFEALLGFLIDLSVGYQGAIALLMLGILVFFIVQGYSLLAAA